MIKFYGPQFKYLAQSLRDSRPTDDDTMGMALWKKIVLTICHDLNRTNEKFNKAAFLRVAGFNKRNQ